VTLRKFIEFVVNQENVKAKIQIGGMLVGYYIICPRKAWLSANNLWMEHESDTVKKGRVIDEKSYKRKKKNVMVRAEAPDGTPLVGKIDWANLNQGILHETKKSSAMEEAHKWQLRFYLWILYLNDVTDENGNPLRGELNYPEQRNTTDIELRDEHMDELEEIVSNIRKMSNRESPPPRIDDRSFCKKCAFEELCYG
jgi:CRISPR-associated exonuclease Cas4